MKACYRILVSTFVAAFFVGCASGSKLVVTQHLDSDADAPYEKVLIVSLFDSFDARRYLEREIVAQVEQRGASAVASTSMMNSRTPVVPKTFIDMVNEIGADALLLTQLTSHAADTIAKDARPKATYNYWPTYYFNVFAVELTEYVEPPRLRTTHSLVLATQLFSVRSREPVWSIETSPVFTEIQEDGLDYQVFVNEATTIVRRLSRDGALDGRPLTFRSDSW